MKLPFQSSDAFRRRGRRGAAFTLTELMVAMTIFVLVIGGCVAGHIFGLRMYQLTYADLSAADTSRNVSGVLGDSIRAAHSVKIGTGDLKSFVEADSQQTQEGNAIQVYASEATNDFVRYFVSSSGKLTSMTADGDTQVLVDSISSTKAFRAEDSAGRTLTNRQNRFVIGLNLQFTKVPGSGIPVGNGQYFDSCQWQMKLAVRARQ